MTARGPATGPRALRISRPARLALVPLLLATGACGNRVPRSDAGDLEPDATDPASHAAVHAVQVRGRIAADDLTIEPVLGTRARRPVPPTDGGAHRLRGVDDDGATLFDFRFDGGPVVDLPTGSEEHFQFVIDLGSGGALRLARIELLSGDGRQAYRQARLSGPALTDTIAAEGTFRLEPLDDGDRVRIRWDTGLFPLVMVQDPDTHRVLALGHDGDVTFIRAGRRFDVIVSEGVRSGALRILFP